MAMNLTVSDYLLKKYTEKEKVKILHYNANNSSLKNELAEAGYENYLGISIEASAPGLYFEKDKNVIYKNNADVLILEDATVMDMNKAFASAAKKIIFQPRNLLHHWSNLIPWIAYFVRNKKWDFEVQTFKDGDKGKKNSIIFSRTYEMENEARTYLSPEVGVNSLFEQLNKKNLNYAVLRWFDKIPFSDINEDIDMLVSDENIEEIQQMLDEKVGILPFDLYSVSGMPGSSFRYTAYYPPYLADKILEDRHLWNGKFFTPNKYNYFLSLLYHVVYHKGEKSGIPLTSKGRNDISKADHDYLSILKNLAAENNIQLKEFNLPYFHNLLSEKGWAPAADTIRKLNTQNDSWLASLVQPSKLNFHKNGELMVFIIREWAVENGLSEFIGDWFEKAGLNMVAKVTLDPNQKQTAAQGLRGGNWKKGPWPISGGDPAIMLVMYDYHPQPLEKTQLKKYPHVKNKNYLLKEQLRAEINSQLPIHKKTNPVHSSDDEIEALDYIAVIAPEKMNEIKEKIMSWDKAYTTDEKVIKDISQHKRRAKVEIIEYKGEKAIKKTYKAGKERFLEREKFAYGELSKECSYIPSLIESGENYIIIPFLKKIPGTDNKYVKGNLLKRRKKEIYEITEFFYSKGYALIDFHPGNIVITDKGIKLIDFEFLYQYENMPKSLKESFDLEGFPDDFRGDLPYEVKAEERRELWQKILN